MSTAASNDQPFVEPPLQFHMSARVSEATQINVSTTSLEELSRVLALFNLVGAPAAEKAGDGPKASSRAKKDVATAPVPAATPAAAPAAAASAPAASTGSTTGITPAQAAEAVRAYGAKNGIDKARELLKKHGFERTADITAEKAGALHAEAVAEEL